MESNMKQVVVEEPLDAEMRCCKPGCCRVPSCIACCPKCARCCCRGCGGCGCRGCGCLKSCLCFVPRLLCYLPRKLLSCHHLKCLLIVVVVVVLLVVIIAGALLMWLHAAQQRAGAVLRVTAAGLEAGEPWRRLPAGCEEEAATFYVDGGAGSPATVVYDYKNLLISYRSGLQQACYVTRLHEDNVQGLDAVAAAFRRRQAEERLPAALADRSLLGTTASILCSVVPIYWA
ncbi:pulmonary surfactant-associated protein C-like [Rhea pennata]|uniref:pulmonary surfactant-associated protein C-like n=1 Tax=Rhea pennata TaxID=8795 RepID=UPI002E2655EF